MSPLKKFSPESIRATARNPNIDLQSFRINSKSKIQHIIRTQQFQELLTKKMQCKGSQLSKIYAN